MLKSEFLIGVNYWASNSACYMWRNFNKEIVERDLQFLAKHGVNCIRVFPLWEDFQPVSKVEVPNSDFFAKTPFLARVGDKPIIMERDNESGISYECVENFKILLETAQTYNIKVVVALLTGWMSGRLFAPEILKGKNLITDPEAILWEKRFVKEFIAQVKNYENIIA